MVVVVAAVVAGAVVVTEKLKMVIPSQTCIIVSFKKIIAFCWNRFSKQHENTPEANKNNENTHMVKTECFSLRQVKAMCKYLATPRLTSEKRRNGVRRLL